MSGGSCRGCPWPERWHGDAIDALRLGDLSSTLRACPERTGRVAGVAASCGMRLM